MKGLGEKEKAWERMKGQEENERPGKAFHRALSLSCQ